VGRSIATRLKEHTLYIRNNNPISAYALHILNNSCLVNMALQRKH